MPMPRGRKFARGYVTLPGRQTMQFRRIAAEMTRRGFKMNHASARGVLLRGLERVARDVLTTVVGGDVTEAEVRRLAGDEDFQCYVCDALDDGMGCDD
jgi:hypothetical protein